MRLKIPHRAKDGSLSKAGTTYLFPTVPSATRTGSRGLRSPVICATRLPVRFMSQIVPWGQV